LYLQAKETMVERDLEMVETTLLAAVAAEQAL
jgi:hypothetical protein